MGIVTKTKEKDHDATEKLAHERTRRCKASWRRSAYWDEEYRKIKESQKSNEKAHAAEDKFEK